MAMADDSSTEKLRLFVAIPMPETVRNVVLSIQQEWQRLVSPMAIRWTKPEQFHLTLRFLGDVPVQRVPALTEAVKTACAGEPPLPLRALGVGFFPHVRSPRVIWVGVNDGEGRLMALQKKIEDAVRSFAEKPVAERFAGHVTLGRVKFLKPQEVEKLASQAQALKDHLFGEWTANEIEIVQSRLLPAGAEHSLLAAIHLTG